MRYRLLICLMAAVGVTNAVAVAGDGFALKGKPKVAMLYFKAKNDGGFTQSADEARIRMEKDLGSPIAYVENIAENRSVIVPAAEKFIQRGYNIIIGGGYGFSDALKELGEKYPDVAFINPGGFTNAANLESVYARTYEPHYLCGMVAGAMSKSGKLGFVAANPFGVVNWTINAFELGAKKMNPNATTTAVFTGAWNDPVKERAATTALIDGGAEVIDQHVDTPTPQIVAQERGVYSTGHHRDLSEFAPKANLCSSVWVWDRFYVPTIKKIEDGTWKPGAFGAFPGLADPTDPNDVACCNAVVPKDVVAKVMAERDAIIHGKQVYAGPLSDGDGKERVAAGQVLGDADLWKMDWFVPGVIAQK